MGIGIVSAHPSAVTGCKSDGQGSGNKKGGACGYSLNPVAPITQLHNPVYTPLRFALRAYLELFVLKKSPRRKGREEPIRLESAFGG